MDEDAAVIYGLGQKARAMCPVRSEPDETQFLVGTLAPRRDDMAMLHRVAFDEENNSIARSVVYQHPMGEVWQVASSPGHSAICATVHLQVRENKAISRASVLRLPDPPTNPNESASVVELCQLPLAENASARTVLFHPNESSTRIAAVDENALTVFDLGADWASDAKETSAIRLDDRSRMKFTTGVWCPHHQCSQIATANETSVRGWDLRSGKQSYHIENAHSLMVRDIDFNANKPYMVVSGGDDCRVRFWDVRNTKSGPLKTLSDHSHWVWSVRYNRFHDQLVLCGSSDSDAFLHAVASLSSDPCGTMAALDVDDDDDDDDASHDRPSRTPLEDRVVCHYDEHEDSVYAVEWSEADPWIFASLSYDGRLVINHVPREEKFKIMMLK